MAEVANPMYRDLAFAYAQVRIQARFAALPAAVDWQHLTASRTLASFLEDARSGPMAAWVEGFSGKSDVHDLEAGIRSLFFEILASVAAWVPDPWRDAVSWVRWLMLLPVLAHARVSGILPAWIERAPELRGLTDTTGRIDEHALQDAGAACLAGREDLLAAWTDHWHRLWPHCSRHAVRELEALTGLLEAHRNAFHRVAPDAAWSLRGELRERLCLNLHRHLLQPATPFLFLVITALDLERLRAALVCRVLFSCRDQAGSALSEAAAA